MPAPLALRIEMERLGLSPHKAHTAEDIRQAQHRAKRGLHVHQPVEAPVEPKPALVKLTKEEDIVDDAPVLEVTAETSEVVDEVTSTVDDQEASVEPEKAKKTKKADDKKAASKKQDQNS